MKGLPSTKKGEEQRRRTKTKTGQLHAATTHAALVTRATRPWPANQRKQGTRRERRSWPYEVRGKTAWAAETYLGEGWRQPWGIVLYNRHERLQRVHRRVGGGAERHLNRGDAKRPDVCLHGGHRSGVQASRGDPGRPKGAHQRAWQLNSTKQQRVASVGLDVPAAAPTPVRDHETRPTRAKRRPTNRPHTTTLVDPWQTHSGAHATHLARHAPPPPPPLSPQQPSPARHPHPLLPPRHCCPSRSPSPSAPPPAPTFSA